MKTVSNSLNDTMLHNEVINIRNNIGLVSVLKPKSIYRDRAKCAFEQIMQKRFFLERSSKWCDGQL
jgi:hypothetical protein